MWYPVSEVRCPEAIRARYLLARSSWIRAPTVHSTSSVVLHIGYAQEGAANLYALVMVPLLVRYWSNRVLHPTGGMHKYCSSTANTLLRRGTVCCSSGIRYIA